MGKKENDDGTMRFYSKEDLLKIFPFKRTKLQQLLNAGVLPVVKVGKTYITSDAMLNRWVEENIGKTIRY